MQLAPCQHIAVSVANRAATVYGAVTAVPRRSVDTTCLQKPKTRLARTLAAARPRRLHVMQLAPCQHIAVSVANRAATVYWAVTAVPRTSADTICLQKPKSRLARILAAARPRRLHVMHLAPCQHIAVSVANRAATVYWAVTAVPRKSADTTCLQKPESRLARILAAARPRRLHVMQLAPCQHIAVSVANRAATVYWAVTAVARTSADTICLQKPKSRLARILAAARPRRLHVMHLAPCQHIAVSVANRAATVYWAVTAVPRKSADTICLQKPKSRLARILAAAWPRRLHVVQLSPCRHIAVSVANRAATVHWAVTAVPRRSVDTTCLQKPKTRLARILAAARPRRLHVMQLAPCQHISVSVANRAATVYWAVTALPPKSVDTTCQQKPITRLARMLAAARPRRLHVVQLAPCQHTAVSVANRAATVHWAVTAVPRRSVDTTCLQKPKTRLARNLAAARPRRLHVMQLAPCQHIAVSVANRAATVYWAVTAVPRTSADTTCLQKPKTRLSRILAAARPRRLNVMQLVPCQHTAVSVVELLGVTLPPRPDRVHARVGDHPQMPERSMVTIPRVSAGVQRTCYTTPWCPQLRGHRTNGRHKSTPPQPRTCAGWRPPANAREIDGDHPQGIRTSATELLHHAMVSPIAWPSNYWATQVHPAPTACMRGLATTRKCQSDRW